MRDHMSVAMQALGYRKSANEGERWYPGGEGIWEPPVSHYVDVLHDRVRVYRMKFFGEAYTPRSFWDTVTVAVFDDVRKFESWCREHGKQSEPGLPAFSNAWD